MKKNYIYIKTKFILELFLPKKYILLFITFTLLSGNLITCQTAGPNFPNTGNFIAGINTDWVNSGFISADDTSYATVLLNSGQISDYIQGTNYGFSIPTGAVINGITVSILRQSNSTSASRSIQDVSLRLVKNGTIVGNNYAATATIWPNSMTAASYGGTTDLWGTLWTPADINNTNFGVALSVNSPSATRTASVDYITIIVHYTPSPSISSFTTTNACIGSNPSIVIIGNHFNTASAVSFNGVAASFIVNSNTQISAILPTGATTGTITVTSPSGTGTSASNFTVNAIPVLEAISGTNSVCVGASTTLANSTSGGLWNSANTGVATINSSGEVFGISAGISLITYTYTNINNCTNSVNTAITVNALPVVSAASSVCIGSAIQLIPNSGGTWICNDTTRATVDNLGLVNGIAEGSVTFTFTNSTTTCSKTTNAVNVLALPAISLQPTATQTVCSGSSVTFSVTASGAGLTYQWYNGLTSLADGGNISGATSPTLIVNPVSLNNQSANYNCVVSGSCTTTANSNNAVLIVIEKVTIVSQPTASQTLCTGNTATLSIAATGAGISYQWYKGLNALIDGGTISGATSNTLSIATLAISDAAANYYCLVSGISPCGAVASSNSILSVNESPIVTGQPTINQTVCENGTASFSIIASGGNLIYQWYKGAMVVSNGGTISGATSATLTINSVTTADEASDYYCIVSNGCVGTHTSNNAALIVSKKAVIPFQSVSTCSQSGFSITPVDGIPNPSTIVPANTLYSWSAPTVTGGITGGAGLSGQTTISGTLNNPTNIDQTAIYTVTPTSGISPTCPGSSFIVSVTVTPKPSIQNRFITICSNGTFTITPTNGSGNTVPTGTTYSWGLPTVTGGVIGATIGSNQTSIIQTLTNSTATVQTAIYTITPFAESCSGATFTVTVTVNPNPVTALNLTTQTACSGIAFSTIIATNTNNLATTYTWTRNNANVSGATNGNSGVIAAGNSFSLTRVLINNTATAQNVIFSFLPTANGCVGNSVTSTVILNPPSYGGTVSSSLPGVNPVIKTITECHYATGTIYLSGHVGNVIRWEFSINGGALWVPISNITSSYTYTNITQSTLFRAVIQNGVACNLAYSLATMVNVIPNVKPTPVTATPQTICAGDASTLYSESGFATSSYIATGGTFNTANPPNWLVDDCGNCLNSGGSNTSDGPIRLSATNGGTYAGTDYSAIGKFAIGSGPYNSIMQTPVFNTFGLPSASLSFNHAFNLQTGAAVSVELSLDGGATYSIVLVKYSGPSTRTPYNAFPLESIDLSNYIGQSNLRIRFVYTGNTNSSWAIDTIIIPEIPTNLTTELVDTSTGQVISNTGTAIVNPLVTTTYAITSHLNGCTSYGPNGTTFITVTVNQRPTANIGPSQTICYSGTATFSVNLTGVAPWSVTYSNGIISTTVNNINTNLYVFSVSGIIINQTYTITALSDSKCISKPQDLSGSALVTVLNGTAGLWTGLISTDWFDCRNWAGGLPSVSINAQIPNGSPRMPIIDPSTSSFAVLYGNIARAQDLIIANSASVTMATFSDLYISSHWKNSGSFTPGGGTVTFNSSTLNQIQTINLGIKTNETFYNLTLNNSNGAKGISVVDGFELTVSNNLSLLNGDLRLVGEAQLVQNGTTANPNSGTGKILIDQQGNKSSYHYNYWSSPVTTNGTNYSISSVLRDGTDTTANPFNPIAITFGADAYFADGVITNPIKLSTRWLFKYTSVSTVYAGWQYVGNLGTLFPAEGYTMKGVTGIAPFTTPQNYVFVGKPNNGTIPLSISLNQSYLVGNPYTSALDANEFIKDNIKDGSGRAATNIFNGALYFWDHFGGQTHILNQYVGGYSCYTLMGGVVAISNDPLINANGSMGSKMPKRYIPVAQGFFIGTGTNSDLTSNNPSLSTTVTGGTINFKNSQRTFKTESESNSVFFRSINQTQTTGEQIDYRQKIRLLYQSPSNVYRQILVGVDENATNYYDIGYDALKVDENGDDLYWNANNSKFIIQAVSNFDEDQILPLGLKTDTSGIASLKIDTLENVSNSTHLYIHDAVTGYDFDIKNGDFNITLPVGVYDNRFSLRFSSNTLNTDSPTQSSTFAMISDNSIKVNSSELIKEISVYDITGKLIIKYKLAELKNQFSNTFNYPNGVYIAKITLDNDLVFSKKLIK